MSLKELVKQLEAEKPDAATEYFATNLDSNPFLNRDAFKEKMDHLDDLSDEELKTLVKNSYTTILQHINNRTDMSYIKSFSSARFINILCNVLSDRIHQYPYKPLETEIIMCCNKLAYDYITLKDKTDDSLTGNFLILAKIVNKFPIEMICRFGIDSDLAATLALARYSTFEEAVNIRRLNFIIVQQPPQTMTLQKVIGIYEALFNNIRDLFIYTFIDNYDAWFEQLKEYDPECIDSVYKMYIREADAVMCILNSTDKNIIKHVLRELMATCFYKHLTSDDLRYSLRSIAPVEGINNLVVESMIEMEQFEKAYIL
jgi:hypothetical protein